MKNNKLRKYFNKIMMFMLTCITLAIPTFATGSAGGTTSSAITDVGTALTGILGYFSGVTSELLGNDLWILGMGFFVVSFVAGFVMYLFQVGRR